MQEQKTYMIQKQEYSAYMVDFYNNINDYNPSGKRKILVVFDDMIADIMTKTISGHN